MGGSLTKQKSLIETVNNIVNTTVNKTINSYKNAATSTQNMELGCTDEQFAFANETYRNKMKWYTLMYNNWLQYGIGKAPEPKIPIDNMCSFTDISQNSIISLKTDNNTKNDILTSLKSELQQKASQYDSLEKVKDIAGYSDTDKETMVKIANNIQNNTFNETLNETINTATANQDMKLSGGQFAHVKQDAVVNMITESIVGNITKGINENTLSSVVDQTSKMKEESGQANAVKYLADMVSSIFNSIFGFYFLIILCGLVLILFAPKLLCIIPPLKIPLSGIGMCSNESKHNKKKHNNTKKYR